MYLFIQFKAERLSLYIYKTKLIAEFGFLAANKNTEWIRPWLAEYILQ